MIMYICPFCKSNNCEELRNDPFFMSQSNQSSSPYQSYSYNDNLVEVLCNDCGIVVKIDPRIYKPKEENQDEVK